MTAKLYTTGAGTGDLRSTISRSLKATESKYVSAAFAYTSVFGSCFLREIVGKLKLDGVSLVTDIRDCITHPEALRIGLDEGWAIRVVNRPEGTFHPKVLVGSVEQKVCIPSDARAIIVGSGNLSKGGLLSNVECGVSLQAARELLAAPVIFSRLWKLGIPLTKAGLTAYEKRFRERNAERSPKDMLALGVSDSPEIPSVRQMRDSVPQRRSVTTSVAEAAWAGLESFTGEYTFQLEFPRDAGQVLRRIVSATGQSPKVTIACEDGLDRPMRYRYYPDNGMFRLNIPNDVPGVTAARQSKSGVALVEATGAAAHPLRVRVSSDPSFISRVAGRSYSLGTLGKTPTRLYGWY